MTPHPGERGPLGWVVVARDSEGDETASCRIFDTRDDAEAEIADMIADDDFPDDVALRPEPIGAPASRGERVEKDDEGRPYQCGAFVSGDARWDCRLESDHASEHEWRLRPPSEPSHADVPREEERGRADWVRIIQEAETTQRWLDALNAGKMEYRQGLREENWAHGLSGTEAIILWWEMEARTAALDADDAIATAKCRHLLDEIDALALRASRPREQQEGEREPCGTELYGGARCALPKPCRLHDRRVDPSATTAESTDG